jgi:hypothetical protein
MGNYSLDRTEYELGQGPRECLTQWVGQEAVIRKSTSGQGARRLTPLLSVFPRFAERFSYRTLDVGTHL